MKILIKVVVLFITTICLAQNPIEKTVGEFSELKVYDLIEVELIKSDNNKIVITGNNTDDVVVSNKNGTLKIKMNFEKAFDGAKNKVVLQYTAIDIIDVNEGAKVTSEETIKQFEIALKAQEGGFINVPVNVTYTNIKAISGGHIKTSGSSKNQDVSLSTGGIYQGELLKTEKAEVTIKAAGEAHVNASKLVDVKIRAGGNVFIYGDPEKVNESSVFGGRIKRM